MIGFVLQMLRIATPYLFTAAGGTIAERSGIVSLGLEGYMLAGACGAAFGSYYGGNAWSGIVWGAAGGALFAAIHALATIRYRADQIVSGIAINILAVGATRFAIRVAFGSSSNSPRVSGGASGLLEFLGLLSILGVAGLINRTRFGLRLRAAGEHPEAAATVGISVSHIRAMAVVASGILAGLGGAFLALDQHQFSDEMTAGRGFIALAAVIFGRWQPFRAGAACLLFAAAEALEINLQGTSAIPSQFVAMIPYVLTVVALAGIVGRSVPPAALGKTGH
ncbi:MAG TPA: ABC transporter permease [Gemmatimonadaceae bacterium]|nr:ABC transporter permease [Gemmatimonadaceae bacterium]